MASGAYNDGVNKHHVLLMAWTATTVCSKGFKHKQHVDVQ